MPNNLDFRVLSLLTQRFNGLTERSRNYLTSWKENSRISSRTCGLHIQGQQQAMQFGRSIRITLLLVLSVFLIVPFLVSSAWQGLNRFTGDATFGSINHDSAVQRSVQHYTANHDWCYFTSPCKRHKPRLYGCLKMSTMARVLTVQGWLSTL